MPSMFFFIPKLQFFKSLSKISVYDILTNNFKVDVKQNLKPEYCVPVKKYFEEVSFYYSITNDNQKPGKCIINRNNSWRDRFILLILVFQLLRLVIYTFWHEEDKLIRTYAGNLEVFLGFNTKYITIPAVGITFYSLAIFCLYQYSSVNHLNWIKVLNAIEGKQSFASIKIFMPLSAKKLIKFTLILISCSSATTQFTPIFVGFFFIVFPFIQK